MVALLYGLVALAGVSWALVATCASTVHGGVNFGVGFSLVGTSSAPFLCGPSFPSSLSSAFPTSSFVVYPSASFPPPSLFASLASFIAASVLWFPLAPPPGFSLPSPSLPFQLALGLCPSVPTFPHPGASASSSHVNVARKVVCVGS